MPHPGLLHPEPLPLRQATVDRTSAGDTQTQFWPSLCGVSGSWYAQSLFEPSECLWRIWGLILNVILPLLPSCWGFSFAVGRGVSFFGGIQHSPVDGCSAATCNFGILTGRRARVLLLHHLGEVHVKQWFSRFIVHPSYLEDFLKHGRLPSTPRVSDSVLVAQSCPTLCNSHGL